MKIWGTKRSTLHDSEHEGQFCFIDTCKDFTRWCSRPCFNTKQIKIQDLNTAVKGLDRLITRRGGILLNNSPPLISNRLPWSPCTSASLPPMPLINCSLNEIVTVFPLQDVHNFHVYPITLTPTFSANSTVEATSEIIFSKACKATCPQLS